MKMNYNSWLEEYENDLTFFYKNIINVLKRKNVLYKEYKFETFCKFIYSKSSKYG